MCKTCPTPGPDHADRYAELAKQYDFSAEWAADQFAKYGCLGYTFLRFALSFDRAASNLDKIDYSAWKNLTLGEFESGAGAAPAYHVGLRRPWWQR